jgi:hypothetical protein
MTGGLLQLVAKGADDAYLIGNPEITLFKTVYRRYANFSKWDGILKFKNRLTFGENNHCLIERSADLIHNLYLNIDLPEVELLYHDFSYEKLENILKQVGLSIEQLYFDTFNVKMPMSEIVDIDFYDDHVVPYIEDSLQNYVNIQTELENQIEGLNDLLLNNYNPSNVFKYFNPTYVQPTEQPYDPISPSLPVKYSMIEQFLKTISQTSTEGVLSNTQYSTISSLYTYLINLYKNIDGNKYKIVHINHIRDLLYETIQKYEYEMDSLTINLTLGYQPEDVIGTNENPRPLQHNYVGENLLVFNSLNISNNPFVFIEYSLNQAIVVIDVTKNNPIEQYFSNLIAKIKLDISLVKELDLYVNYKNYITEVSKTNPIIYSQNNIITVKDTIVNYLENLLVNNLKQFMKLLNILQYFKFKPSMTKMQIDNTLFYGMFCPTTTTGISSSTIYRYDEDKKLFSYDAEPLVRPTGYYYTNWVKNNVDIFYNSLSSIMAGEFINATAYSLEYKYIPYFTNRTYMSFYNLIGSDPYNICGITGGTLIFNDSTLDAKIKFLEFTPLLVAKNLCELFSQSSPLFGPSVVWVSSNLNLQKYVNYFLSLYNVTPGVGETSRIDVIKNYLLVRTESFASTSSSIATHIFTPNKVYSINDINNVIPNMTVLPLRDKNLLGIIYQPSISINRIFPNFEIDVPDTLLPLDVMILMIATDLLLDIGPSLPLSITDSFKINLMKIIKLYVLNFSDIPNVSTPMIDSSYYDVNLHNYVVNYSPNVTPFGNNIHRLSSIWNNISRSQITKFNSIFATKFISTTYYRTSVINKTPSGEYKKVLYQGDKIGVGKTMKQAFEVFVSNFFNNRLGIDEIQNIDTLEKIMETTNFYAIELIDPYYTIELALSNISGIIDNYNSVSFGVKQATRIKESPFMSTSNLINKDIFYYNSIFNILMKGIRNIDINIDANENVIIENLSFINDDRNNITTDGYISIFFKKLANPTIITGSSLILKKAFGDILKTLKFVPLDGTLTLKCGEMYSKLFEDFLDKSDIQHYEDPNDAPDISITCGVIESLLQMAHNIKSKTGTDEHTYFVKLLDYFEISLNTSPSEYPNDISLQLIYDNTTYLVGDDYKIYISPTNSTGNLYETSNGPTNTNPMKYTNSTIVDKYWNFDTIYGIIKFLLDIIIYDISENSTFKLIFGSKNEKMVMNNMKNYCENNYEKITKYVSMLSNNGQFLDSEIYNRLYVLRNTVENNDKRAYFAWSEYIGYNIIDTIDIKIGDQLIDSHSGEWMHTDCMLMYEQSKKKNHNIMVGNVEELTSYTKTGKKKYSLYIPLQFWFNKYFNCSYPLIASIYSHVDMNVKLKKLESIAYWDIKDTYFVRKPKLDGYLQATYITVETEERARIAQRKHDFLIEVVQKTGKLISNGNDIIVNFEKSTITRSISFNNICKDLIWICRFIKNNKSEIDKKNEILKWNNYTYFANKEHIKKFRILFDGVYREDWKKSGYYTSVQPYYKGYSSLGDNMFLYSFAIHPNKLQPSGGVNMDCFSDVAIEVEISDEMAEKVKNGEYVVEWQIFNKSYNILRLMSGMAGLAYFSSH